MLSPARPLASLAYWVGSQGGEEAVLGTQGAADALVPGGLRLPTPPCPGVRLWGWPVLGGDCMSQPGVQGRTTRLYK